MGQRAYYFRGSREWNGLADNIKNTKDVDSFDRTLFNMICLIRNNFEYFLNNFKCVLNLIKLLQIRFLFLITSII